MLANYLDFLLPSNKNGKDEVRVGVVDREDQGVNRFPRVLGVRTGYDPDQVDALIRRIEATLGRGSLEGAPVTADEIRMSRFNTKLGGYNEVAVDYALDAFVVAVEIHAQGANPAPLADPPLIPAPPDQVLTHSAPPAQAPWPDVSHQASHSWPDVSRQASEPWPGRSHQSTPPRQTPSQSPFTSSFGEPPPPSALLPAQASYPDPLRDPAMEAGSDSLPDAAPRSPRPEPVPTSGSRFIPVPEAEPPGVERDDAAPGGPVAADLRRAGAAPVEGVRSEVQVEDAGGPAEEDDDEAPTLPGLAKVTRRQSSEGDTEAGAADEGAHPVAEDLMAAWLETQAVRVERVLFRPGRLGAGYNEDEVDIFLDRIVATLRRTTGHPLTAEQVRRATFSTVVFKSGYAVSQVDAFLTEIADVLDRRDARLSEQPA